MATNTTAPAAAAGASITTHQVVIVGGGITGLTLAVMLQQLGVDYVLLEAYSSVTPQLGASLGLFPNGLRILDQLGLLPAVEAAAVNTANCTWRDSGRRGKRIMARDVGSVVAARHGYAPCFLSRHQLVCILEGAVRDKKRLLVNAKVSRIDDADNEGCARVYTTDGRVFEAQVVVGADGVRSLVRTEMWRHAEERETQAATASQPHEITTKSSSWTIPASDKAPVPCEHACLFGTSRPKAGIAPGDTIAACGDRAAAGLMGAACGDVMFFWFWTLPPSNNSCPITDIPRVTPEQEAHERERCRDVIVTDGGVTMGQILDDVYGTLGATVLPNFVLDRWSSGGRVVVIGDAAHKFNPLVGQGGNSCIESCAALVNQLQAHWALESLTTAFAALEAERVPRVRSMVDQCQDAMHKTAWESWKPRVLQRYIAPLLPVSILADFHKPMLTPSLRLKGAEFAEPSVREHSVPWDDEKADMPKLQDVREKGTVVVASAPVAAAAA
ncbi:hypothetical protein Micbo1qcDRAFT_189971 [Microdochium bolleyi]|uniref:FAD-binding domain-containing protein n=1 Tax=Microdochium bolleyi TaxID=196109 RepID=A0A136IT94_9PEZI|nr:hypothetical protein Micbo1qcDRAFT_189971 [Microdochium bolleyi]